MNELALEQLVQLLARLVADGDITEVQAGRILAYWQDRPQAELAAVLPLALAQGVGPLQADDDAAPWLPFLLLSRSATRAERVRLLNVAQDAHAAEMVRLVGELEARRLTVAEWQAAARRVNAQLLQRARLLGGDTPLQAQAALAEIERTQAAYLQRFADQLGAHAGSQFVAGVGR